MPRLAFTFLFLLLAAATIYFLVFAQWEGIRGAREELRQLTAVQDELAELTEARDRLKRTYDGIAIEEREKLQELVPAEPSTDLFLIDLETIAQRHGLALQQVDFGTGERSSALEPRKPQPYAALSVRLTVRGPYESLPRFLADLERNLRLVDVVGVSFAASQGAPVAVSIQGRIYYRP